jgi:hypothetical protein
MKVSKVEFIFETILSFMVDEHQGDRREEAVVHYLYLNQEVRCSRCRSSRCGHVLFVQQFLDVNPAWQIADLIRDCTGAGLSPEFIGTMQRVFDRAVINERGRSTPQRDHEAKPKGLPPSFSIIELE